MNGPSRASRPSPAIATVATPALALGLLAPDPVPVLLVTVVAAGLAAYLRARRSPQRVPGGPIAALIAAFASIAVPAVAVPVGFVALILSTLTGIGFLAWIAATSGGPAGLPGILRALGGPAMVSASAVVVALTLPGLAAGSGVAAVFVVAALGLVAYLVAQSVTPAPPVPEATL